MSCGRISLATHTFSDIRLLKLLREWEQGYKYENGNENGFPFLFSCLVRHKKYVQE